MEKSPGSGMGQEMRTALTSPEASGKVLPAELMPVQICVYYAANRSI